MSGNLSRFEYRGHSPKGRHKLYSCKNGHCRWHVSNIFKPKLGLRSPKRHVCEAMRSMSFDDDAGKHQFECVHIRMIACHCRSRSNVCVHNPQAQIEAAAAGVFRSVPIFPPFRLQISELGRDQQSVLQITQVQAGRHSPASRVKPMQLARGQQRHAMWRTSLCPRAMRLLRGWRQGAHAC